MAVAYYSGHDGGDRETVVKVPDPLFMVTSWWRCVGMVVTE